MAPFRPLPGLTSAAWPMRLLLLAGIVAALSLGRDVLAPLALALLLTIAALPLVEWMERRGLPRVPAAVFVLVLAVLVCLSVVGLVLSQALTLAGELPRYESTLREKLLLIGEGSGPINRLVDLYGRLLTTLDGPAGTEVAAVRVTSADSNPLASVAEVGLLIAAPFTTLAVTLLLMAFILIQREQVRDRVLRLAGIHEMHRTTQTMTAATERVGRFLLVQVLLNAAMGLAIGLGLWALGVPQAPLWGALTFALRFVPFLGAPLSALFPLAIAFATTDGWTTVLLVIALFVVVDLLVGYVLEPWLYGASIGVSPLALLLSAAFWALLWGPLGLILAPAITACLLTLGRNVPALSFLDVLLGDSQVLDAPARFYQRLLAGDAARAAALLAAEAAAAGVAPALDRLVLPAIAQISQDRGAPSFGPALTLTSARTLLQALETLGEPEDTAPEVLVLPMGGALDRAAAAALVAVLIEGGHAAGMEAAPGHRARLVVLAAALAPRTPRVLRAVAAAAARGTAVLAFGATQEAREGFAAAGHAAVSASGIEAALGETPDLVAA